MKTKDEMSDLDVRKIARIKDKATSKYLEVIEFAVSNTERTCIELPPSVVNSPVSFGNELLDAGAILPKDDNVLKHLLTKVAKSDALEQRVYETQVGWTQNGRAYVTIDGVIGCVAEKIVGVNRSNKVDDASGRLSINGTCQAWRESVATLARNSSSMMFTICVAMAAPLLYAQKRRSFTICMSGKTRTGKTMATLMGASVIGIGQIEQMITWRLKDARLEQRLAEYNDAMFPIDDLETIVEKGDKAKYLRIRNVAYNLEQGWSTGRHDSFTMAHGGTHEQWRCIAVTSCEKAVVDLARSVKLNRQPGETLRLIDVPVLLDGLDHIFDRLPCDLDTSDFPKWKEHKFAEVADACEQNHGAAFQVYIQKLIAHGPTLKDYIKKGEKYFIEKVCDDKDGDVARDVAKKFGLIFVGGMLGIRYGLLPWGKTELLDAISKCYRGARDLLPDDGVVLREGTALLIEKLRSLPSLSQLKTKNSAVGDADGYCGRNIQGADRWLIKREVFNSIFASTYQRDLVVAFLIKLKRITTALKNGTEGANDLTPKGQFEWADGQRRRSYEILRKRPS